MALLKATTGQALNEMWIAGYLPGTDASVPVTDFSAYDLQSGMYSIARII